MFKHRGTLAIASVCLFAGAALVPAGVAGAGSLLAVFISNDSNNPIPTRVVGTAKVDGTVGTPYQKELLIGIPADRLGNDEGATVPAGKDLIIDHVSVHVSHRTHTVRIWLDAFAGDQNVGAQLLPITEAPAASGVFYTSDASESTSLRVPDRYEARVRVEGLGSGGLAEAQIIGRLVDEVPIAS
jgi:hypothetical protein